MDGHLSGESSAIAKRLARLGVYAAVLVVPVIYSNSLTSDGYITVKNTALVLCGAFVLVALGLGLAGGKPQLRFGWWAVIIGLTLLAQLFSIAGTSNPGLSLNQILRLAALAGLFFSVVWVQSSNRGVLRIAALAVAVASVVSVLGIVDFWTSAIFPQIRDSYGFRMFGATLGHDNFAGQYLIAVLPLAFAILAIGVFEQKMLVAFASLAASCTILVFLSITFSRGAWLGFGGSAILFAVLLALHSRKYRPVNSAGWSRQRKAAGVICAAVLVAVGAVSFTQIRREKGQTAARKAEETLQLSDAPVAFRLKLWPGALRLCRQHPIFGVGCGAFSLYYPAARLPQERRIAGEGISVRQPHNDYIRIAAESGAAGMITAAWLALSVLLLGLRAVKRRPSSPRSLIATGALCGIVATLVHSFFSSNLYMPASATMLWVNMGIIVGSFAPPRASGRQLGRSARGAVLVCLAALALFMAVRAGRFLLADYHFCQGRALARRGQTDAAIASLRKSVLLAGYYIEPRILLGKLLVVKQNYQEAIDLLSGARQLCPYWPQVLNNLGVAYSQRASRSGDPGSLIQAYDAFKTAVELNPSFKEAWLNLGSTFLSLGQPKKAEEALRRSLRLWPGRPDPAAKLAEALAAQGRFDEAQRVLTSAIAVCPQDARLFNNLGMLLARKGKDEDAIEYFQKAISLSDRLFEPHLNLARILERHGEVDKAVREYRVALQIKPDLEAARSALERLLNTTNSGQK